MLKPKVAFFMAHYGRPEYFDMTMRSIKDSQEYDNVDFYIVEDDNPNVGLRERIIDFFDAVKDKDYDILMKMDADCLVPKNYVNNICHKLFTTDVDIISPNVVPSNAAFIYGADDIEGKGYRPGKIIGGLWNFSPSLIKDMYFERVGTEGLTGAISILKQIATEKEPKIGWIPEIEVEDIGYWKGTHPYHIKSKEHELYSKKVGRQIAWSA